MSALNETVSDILNTPSRFGGGISNNTNNATYTPYLLRRWQRTPFVVAGNGVGVAKTITRGALDATKALADGSKDLVHLSAASLIAPVKVMLRGVLDGSHTWAATKISMYDTAKFALKQAKNQFRKSRPSFLGRSRRDADAAKDEPVKQDAAIDDAAAESEDMEHDDKFVEAVSTLIMNPTTCRTNLQVISCEKLDNNDESASGGSSSTQDPNKPEQPDSDDNDDDDDDSNSTKLLSLCMVEIEIVDCDGDDDGKDDKPDDQSSSSSSSQSPPVSKKVRRSLYSKYKLRRFNATTAFKKSRSKRSSPILTPLLLSPFTYVSKWLENHRRSSFVRRVLGAATPPPTGVQSNINIEQRNKRSVVNSTTNITMIKPGSDEGGKPMINVSTDSGAPQISAKLCNDSERSGKMCVDPYPPIWLPIFGKKGLTSTPSSNDSTTDPTAAPSDPAASSSSSENPPAASSSSETAPADADTPAETPAGDGSAAEESGSMIRLRRQVYSPGMI